MSFQTNKSNNKLFRNFSPEIMDHRCKGRMMDRRVDIIVKFLRSLLLPDGAAVLEIACGTGQTMARVARFFPKLKFIGIDLSTEYIVYANEYYAKKQSNIDYRQGSLSNITAIITRHVNAVYSVNLWHHIPIKDISAAAKDISSILTADSKYFSLEPNSLNFYIWLYQCFTKGERPFYCHQEGEMIAEFLPLTDRHYYYIFPNVMTKIPVWLQKIEYFLESCPILAGSHVSIYKNRSGKREP